MDRRERILKEKRIWYAQERFDTDDMFKTLDYADVHCEEDLEKLSDNQIDIIYSGFDESLYNWHGIKMSDLNV